MNDRLHTAIHEAGHAVIGRVLGMVCGDASIIVDEDEGEAGHSICADPYEVFDAWDKREKWRPMASIWRGRILSFMAGREAEEECLGQCEGGDGEDLYQINLMFDYAKVPGSQCSGDTAEIRYEKRLRQRARWLVRRHRGKIERIAEELLREGYLSAKMIDALIFPAAATEATLRAR